VPSRAREGVEYVIIDAPDPRTTSIERLLVDELIRRASLGLRRDKLERLIARKYVDVGPPEAPEPAA
jgi:hypothetical protein